MIRQNFNADWTVEKGDGNSRMNSFLGNTQTKTVHLPYDAMIHEARTPDTKNGAQTGFYPGGEYIFQKHFTAPQAWQGKPVSLVFEGVYQTALVYLNGWLLTRNVNGYAEFTVEAGPYLKYGADNLLKVIADNSLEPNSRWYTGSGIYCLKAYILMYIFHFSHCRMRTTIRATRSICRRIPCVSPPGRRTRALPCWM